MNRWGDFELLEEIGRGSFGTVYRANHPTLQQQVALKLVPVSSGNARDIEKALDEPRRLASVRHQHVVVVHDARHIDGFVGICMELVRGESLAQLVARGGRLGAEETMACGASLCRALAAIHRATIIHNDVKAQNVMRENGGRLVLMDFGAGRRLLDPQGTTGMYLVGTPAYMAPELFELRPASPSSDIYSLGVLLFYLLTAEYPVDAATMEQFAAAHASRRRRYLGDVRDDIPGRLLTVVDRALAHEPADRYGSCGEMLTDLLDRNSRPGTRRPRKRPAPPAGGPEPRPQGRPLLAMERTLSSARQWAGGWIGPGAAGLAALVVVMWLLGFLASKAYNDMFGLFGEFASESPLTWLEVGFRALLLPLAYMVIVVTAVAVVRLFWQMATRLSPALDTWSARTSQRIARAGAQTGLTDDGSLPTLVLFLQVLLVAAVYWTFLDLITAFSSSIAVETIEEHARLARSNESEWLRFCAAASLLALAGGLAWSAIIRRRPASGGGAGAIVAGIALTGFCAAMFVVPWRIYQQSFFETALFDSAPCFVVSSRPPRLQLFCPTSTTRNPIVSVDDPKLSRPDPSQPRNIFDAAAQAGRPQGDE